MPALEADFAGAAEDWRVQYRHLRRPSYRGGRERNRTSFSVSGSAESHDGVAGQETGPHRAYPWSGVVPSLMPGPLIYCRRYRLRLRGKLRYSLFRRSGASGLGGDDCREPLGSSSAAQPIALRVAYPRGVYPDWKRRCVLQHQSCLGSLLAPCLCASRRCPKLWK